MDQPPLTMPIRIRLEEAAPLRHLVEAATQGGSLVAVEDLVLQHLEPQQLPLVAQYLGHQLLVEVEVCSLELAPILHLRDLGSALPRNQVHQQQDLGQHLPLVPHQHSGHLQLLELLQRLEQLLLQEEQLLEHKHRHLEQELLPHLAQPLEQVLQTLLQPLAPWPLGRQAEALLVEWLRHLKALGLLQQLPLPQQHLNSALGDDYMKHLNLFLHQKKGIFSEFETMFKKIKHVYVAER